MSIDTIETQTAPAEEKTTEKLDATEITGITVNYTLVDALRDAGAEVKQVFGSWGDGQNTGCALSGAAAAAKRRNLI